MHFAFFKVGQRTDNGLVKFSSLSLLIVFYIILIVVVLLGIGFGSLTGFAANGASSLTGNAVDNPYDLGIASSGLSGSSENLLSSGSISSSSSSTGGSVVIIILAAYLIVSAILFFVGLVEIKDDVRFTKMGAIFGFLSMNMQYLLLFAVGILWSAILFGGYLFLLVVLLLIPFVVIFLHFLFLTRALFDASKQFEEGPQHSPTTYREYSPYPAKASVSNSNMDN